MLKGLMPVSVMLLVSLFGVSSASAYGCGWMGSGSHASDHFGWCWVTDSNHIQGCDTGLGCGLMHLGHYDLRDEDIARIEEILEEARVQISEILSEYDSGNQSTSSSGCHCCH